MCIFLQIFWLSPTKTNIKCFSCFAWLIVVIIVVLLQTTRGLLHKASLTGDCNSARALLEVGVDVDQRDKVVIYF